MLYSVSQVRILTQLEEGLGGWVADMLRLQRLLHPEGGPHGLNALRVALVVLPHSQPSVAAYLNLLALEANSIRLLEVIIHLIIHNH